MQITICSYSFACVLIIVNVIVLQGKTPCTSASHSMWWSPWVRVGYLHWLIARRKNSTSASYRVSKPPWEQVGVGCSTQMQLVQRYSLARVLPTFGCCITLLLVPKVVLPLCNLYWSFSYTYVCICTVWNWYVEVPEQSSPPMVSFSASVNTVLISRIIRQTTWSPLQQWSTNQTIIASADQ